MLSDNFVLNDAAAAAKTFNLVSQNGSERKRLDVSTTAAAPRTMLVRHQTVGSGPQISDRHTISFQKQMADSDGDVQTITASLVLTVPRDSGTASQIDDLYTFVKNFLATGANLTAVLRGES